MSKQVKTTFAKFNPFTGEKVSNKAIINPEDLEICDDPLPEERRYGDGKYDAKFSALKYGQALKCAPDSVGRISNALRSWLKKHNKKGQVKSCLHYDNKPNGGRVWLLKP